MGFSNQQLNFWGNQLNFSFSIIIEKSDHKMISVFETCSYKFRLISNWYNRASFVTKEAPSSRTPYSLGLISKRVLRKRITWHAAWFSINTAWPSSKYLYAPQNLPTHELWDILAIWLKIVLDTLKDVLFARGLKLEN